MSIYTFLAYFAITCHLILIREFGGVTTVLVGNARKAVTIALSFVLFPKPLSSLYLVGGIMVFGSLVTLAYFKEADKAKSAGAITGVGAGSDVGGIVVAAAAAGKREQAARARHAARHSPLPQGREAHHEGDQPPQMRAAAALARARVAAGSRTQGLHAPHRPRLVGIHALCRLARRLSFGRQRYFCLRRNRRTDDAWLRGSVPY